MTASPEPDLYYLDYSEHFLPLVDGLARKLAETDWLPGFVVGLGRGGLVPAVYLSHRLNVPMLSVDHSSKMPGFADELLVKLAAMSSSGTQFLFIDDINDSGGTIEYIKALLNEHHAALSNVRFGVLLNNTRSRADVDLWAEHIDRNTDKRWFVFPWESLASETAIIEEANTVPERLR